MTKENIIQNIFKYETWFNENRIPKKSFSHGSLPYSQGNILAHCHAMLDEIKVFLKGEKMDRAQKYLGFVEGCFWSLGIFTLDSFKDDNH